MAIERIFFAVLLFALPEFSAAQSAVSGRYLVEPVVGSMFIGEAEDIDVFGARGTWRRSYSQSVYATVIHGRRSDSQRYEEPYNRNRSSSSRTFTIASIGVGSTIIDRDATGNVGAHALVGIGFASYVAKRTYVYEGNDGSIERSEFDENKTGPALDFSLIGELELLSPRILLRVQAGGYLALDPILQRFESPRWFPGVSITAGLAIAF